MMRRTSGWGRFLRLPDGPLTTAPVPCHPGGSASLGPRYWYRRSGWGGGVPPWSPSLGMVGPRLGHGVLEREGANVPNRTPRAAFTTSNGNSKDDGKALKKKMLVPIEEKRMFTMPRTAHVNPCVPHPWHRGGYSRHRDSTNCF